MEANHRQDEKPVSAPDLIDITYIRTWAGWAYLLATVIDLHSRSFVGWAIADYMRTNSVIDALEMACGRRNPPAGLPEALDNQLLDTIEYE